MKKVIKFIAAGVALLMLASCSAAQPAETPIGAPTEEAPAEMKKIVVGASPTPHAQILAEAKKVLAEKGYELEITEFVDYVQPNLTLANNELDANFFQHQPYLDDFNAENNTELVSIGSIHYEPFGIYADKTASLEELPDGATVAVPNDTTNEARALLLLEEYGLIKLSGDKGLQSTAIDIMENPKNLVINEIEAAQLARTLQDVDIAVINGNYAIQAGLSVADALGIEDSSSAGAETFANVLVVRAGDEGREDLLALLEALRSEEVKKFMEDTYGGAVVPMF